jgi:hypothetical protein
LDSAPEIRDVFGDFDDEEEDMGYAAQQDIEQDSNVSVSQCIATYISFIC